jgi:single-strand DNA-binding protein
LRSLNRVELIGHLGGDCEMRFTPTGVARTTFSVATSRRWKVKGTEEWKEETDWHRCVLWDSESLSAFLLRGTHVFIEGAMKTRQYEKEGQSHYVTEITVQNVILLDKKPDAAGGPVSKPRGSRGSSAPPAAGSAPPPPDDGLGITDDDVPF